MLENKNVLPPNFYAVLIGFNKYKDRERLSDLQFAERDAQEMYKVLTDPQIGNYSKDNISLIIGDVSNDYIQSKLYNQVVKGRTKDDTVLVYYSGHGFIAGDLEDAYLATPEITVSHILNNPAAGLQMKWLYNEIFVRTQARFVILLLDCCHSGAFCPSVKDDNNALRMNLIEEKDVSGEGRIAFVSSPRGVSSRESAPFQNGIFTYYLLEGLRGKAADKETGEVTMNSLITYVEGRTPPNQPPVHYGQSTKIVLTHHPIEKIRKLFGEKAPEDSFVSPDTDQSQSIRTLPNPMDQQISIMDQIINNIAKQNSELMADQKILNAIRQLVDADIAFVERVEKDNRVYRRFQSSLKNKDGSAEKYRSSILNSIFSALIQPRELLAASRFGFYRSYKVKGVTKYYIAIPLRMEYPREFLLLPGVPVEKLEYGEVLGHLVLSLYNATNGLTLLETNDLGTTHIENTLYDDLKRSFGYVPGSVYQKRLSNFSHHLKTIKFVFEPIVSLGMKNPEIVSWEALARDPKTGNAPFALFKAAELWGPTFISKLDIFCLQQATQTYVSLWEAERGAQKRKDPLSVNVYPDTLYWPEYKNEVKKIVRKEDLLKPSELVLEISERRTAPKPTYNNHHQTPLDFFVDKLGEYTNEFDIAFAIDDFGVGFSSVDRLAKLGLDHIKIDRDVLHHRYPALTIEYVIKMVKKLRPGHTNIVVEGYDGLQRISLAEMFELGIRYVQGHLIRRGSETLHELEGEVKTYLLNQLNDITSQADLNSSD